MASGNEKGRQKRVNTVLEVVNFDLYTNAEMDNDA